MPDTLIALEGGLDTRSASINAPKGTCANMVNWIKDQGPGLVRRKGWARYDGRVQGPGLDDPLVIPYSPANLSGSFIYGEQVEIAAAGHSTLNAFFIGNADLGTLGRFICFAYPVQSFTQWDDPTSYPASTSVKGLLSGAFLTTGSGQPMLMNDSQLSVIAYDSIKTVIQNAHAASVGAVPGRNESPIDAAFTFNDMSYAIHDCVVFTYNSGGDGANVPLEGNVLKTFVGGIMAGTILSIDIDSGTWATSDAAGTIVVYDYPLGQTFPAVGDLLDLYAADGTTLIASRFLRYAGQGDPADTRALLYQTQEQYVKTFTNQEYGGTIVTKPPWIENLGPPTWQRVALTRELPYTCVGTLAGTPGFGPTGTSEYSIYEYSRTGLSSPIAALQPITTAESYPTVATDISGTGRWTNPNNIKIQDTLVAVHAAIGQGQETAYIRGTGFDFSAIPAGSTILGVTVRLRAMSNAATAVKDYDVRLVSNAFQNGVGQTNKAVGQWLANGVLTDYTYGGTSDTWGEPTLTTDIILDPSFGFQARWKKPTGGALQTVSVDAFAIAITYVPPSRIVYIRDPSIVGAPAQDIVARIIHYSIESGSFANNTATGTLTLIMQGTEAQGTAAGKIRRIGAGNEIRTLPSTAGTNAANGTLLGYATAEDYPVSFPPSVALDAASSSYEVIDANFWSAVDGRAAYLANGVEFAAMFDEQYVVRIRSGRPIAEDNPRHLASHLGFLHLGFNSGSVIFTGKNHPLSVLGQITSGVYNFGEPITGMLTLNGQTLGVWTDRATRGLQGNSPTTVGGGSGYTPIMISPAINCIEYSLVNLVGEAVWMSYRGVETVRTVNAYGDFETLPLSAPAQSWLKGRIQVDLIIGSRPSRLVGAIGVRNERQYRAFWGDGFVFTLTLFDAGDLPVCTIQQLARPNATGAPITGANQPPTNAGVIRHVYNGTLSDGKEMIFACFENQNATIVPAAGVGTSTGPYFPYVALLDCGYSDDIQPYIPNWVEFNAFYAGYPSQQQKWGACTLFVNGYDGTQVDFHTKLNYDGPIIEYTHQSNQLGIASSDIVQSRTYVLNARQAKAYIPVPQCYLTFDIAGDGRCLKLLIDGSQDNSGLSTRTKPTLTPLRITHLSLQTTPLRTDNN